MAINKISVKVRADGAGQFIIDDMDITESVTGIVFRGRPGRPPILTLDTTPAETNLEVPAEVRIICPFCRMEMIQTTYMTVEEKLRSCWTCDCPPRVTVEK